VIADNELESGTVGIKSLREHRDQQTVKRAEVAEVLSREYFIGSES